MRMLVTGASGQLARSLAELDGSAPGVAIEARGRPDIDLESPATIAAEIDRVRPDIVVNAAAYTDVDKAESDGARALAVNGTGAGAVAAAAAARQLPLIHLSTDYVFGGGEGRLRHEDDPPEPRSAYGRSKLAGEVAAAHANPDHVILRTAWLYSPFGSNFVRTILRLAREREEIRVVDDQFGSPTYSPDLASAIIAIAARLIDAPRDPAIRGIFHLAGPEGASRYQFAREIMRASGECGGPVARIVPIDTSAYPTAAERPRDSRLDSSKARAAFGIELPPLAVSLRACVGRLQT